MRSHDHLSDSELLQKFYQSGENDWLGLLLKRYTLLLFGVCMKYLKDEEAAKDTVQQVFEKALKEIPKYKISHFKSWLYMVAKNECLMRFRKQQPVRFQDELSDNLLPASAADDEAAIKKEQLLNLTEQALQKLNAEQRTCITLFYLEKKSYSQIAELTSYSQAQVKSYIQNGKRNLKIILEKNMSNE